ncbi:MAG TPA: CarD family transcriptional regulator [bacterium]|nr:CarD family transcriptional regulator [bacterium]
MEFKVGQDIVYPKYGVGKILEIKSRKLPEGRTKGVLIKFPARHMEVWVPEERLRNTKVRKPITRGQARRIYRILKGRASFRMSSKAKERAQFYKDKVLSGDPGQLAETVRDLVRLSIRKSLNVREAEIANAALRTLVRELALATGKDVETIRGELDELLYR